MTPMKIMSDFAHAILALEAATKSEDEPAIAKAMAEIVRVWGLYSGDDHAITLFVRQMDQVLEESNLA